ncbi:hypothetical protein V8C44DRAFT_325807 [Trichoderma aethiopicum]
MTSQLNCRPPPDLEPSRTNLSLSKTAASGSSKGSRHDETASGAKSYFNSPSGVSQPNEVSERRLSFPRIVFRRPVRQSMLSSSGQSPVIRSSSTACSSGRETLSRQGGNASSVLAPTFVQGLLSQILA